SGCKQLIDFLNNLFSLNKIVSAKFSKPVRVFCYFLTLITNYCSIISLHLPKEIGGV
ncbi:uncharacterized protein K441DRAFT_567211, partial [Cenococcum geophilum 1.58]|uniref:uncharacterized protein n=1 Tax=Cenococcum geophilum 1.58 TaxID=794803 RepID=UPI00358E099C